MSGRISFQFFTLLLLVFRVHHLRLCLLSRRQRCQVEPIEQNFGEKLLLTGDRFSDTLGSSEFTPHQSATLSPEADLAQRRKLLKCALATSKSI